MQYFNNLQGVTSERRMKVNDSALNSHTEIIAKYADMVYKLAFSQTKNNADADDIFQEVFLRLVRSKKQFENDEHMKAWLIRVTINCCKSFWGLTWFKITMPLKEEVTSSFPEKSEVYYAIMDLPKKYRIVIHLFYRERMSIEEISQVLKIKSSTITSQLTRARKLLKKILKEEYDFEESR
ncbi:MAG: polymerase subunit sigma-24 [Bacillales bacterium]|jgi:RNA polymerase sigma-70 factor (ECF subfamily)|nr:polymerase subunit sigma-24 [Bacillales bacterium]